MKQTNRWLSPALFRQEAEWPFAKLASYTSLKPMKTGRWMLDVGCWLLLAVAVTSAADTSAERGKQIIDRAIAALGGNNFLHMQDRVESGRAYSFYREQLSGLSLAKIYTRYLI